VAPEIDVDINLRSPIATVIGGVGAAIGGIGNAIGGATKLVGNTIETIGNIAKAGSAAGGDAPDRTVNESNLGLVAAAAQQSVKGKGGSGTLPARKTATKQKPSQNLSTEKLLSIAVKHLSSIDASLKAQMDYNVQATREEAKQEKENDIEGKNNVFTRFADRMKMKASNAAGAAKEKGMDFAKTAAMIAAAALVMKLSTLKPETIERLKKTIDEFQQKYKWFFEDVLPFLSGAMLGASVGRLGGPWGMLIGAIAGGLLSWGIGEIIRNNRDKKEIDRSIAEPYVPEGDPEKNLKPLTDEEKALLEDFRKAITEARRPIGGKAGQELASGAAQEVERLRPKVRALLKSRRPDLNDAELDKIVSDADILAINDAVKKGIAPPKQDATKQSQSGGIPDIAYDIVLGAGKFGRTEDFYDGKKLTQLTVSEAMQFGKDVLQPRSKAAGLGKLPSGEVVGDSGVGAFATNRTTLKGAIAAGIIKPDDIYDKAAQEKVANWVYSYMNKQNNLHNAWAYFQKTGERSSTKSFEEQKYNIAQAEVGAYAGMTGQKPVSGTANAVGNTLTALGNARETFVNALAEQNKNLTPRDPNLTQQMAVDQKANEIRQQAVALENSMRGDAKKEEDRKNAAAQMTPGAKLAKANQGKMEALDPNYKTDSNNIISKYFVYFGLAA
jgi:hypothetical protein